MNSILMILFPDKTDQKSPRWLPFDLVVRYIITVSEYNGMKLQFILTYYHSICFGKHNNSWMCRCANCTLAFVAVCFISILPSGLDSGVLIKWIATKFKIIIWPFGDNRYLTWWKGFVLQDLVLKITFYLKLAFQAK